MGFPLRQIAFLLAALISLMGCVMERGKDRSEADGWFRSAPTTSRATSPERADARAEPKTLFPDQAASGGAAKLEPFVNEGTGRLIGQPLPLQDNAVTFDDAGDITLNVVDADIREVVRLLLDDGLNANYVIDPAVAGSITIRTSRPVPAEQIKPLLSSVLNANGAALVEKDGVFQILPSAQAAIAGGRPSTRLSLKAGEPGSGILVAPLRYAEADRLAELLQPFVANQGAIQVDSSRNTLLIAGSADQIATMSDLIDMFDVDWMAGMSFGFYPLERASASDLALELDQIFGLDENSTSRSLRFLPIDRLNALLAIATEPASLRRVQSWVERLDKIGEGDEEQIYVYSVQNGRAADLASVLGELFDIRSTVIGPDPLLAPGLEPIELGAPSLLDEGETRAIDEERPGFGDRPSPQRRRGPDPFTVGGQRDLTEGAEDSNTRIVADEANNSLLIRALPKEYRKIEAALRELDKPPLQVLLEATIAEVTLRDELTYGVQWFFDRGDIDLVLSEDQFGVVEPFFPGFSGILSSNDVRIVIDALDEVSDVRVISSPQILVLDNQTAQLEVGDEVPIITRQSEGIDTSDARLVSTVEQRQTGVILNVTPRVNASGLVVLDIQQEVSNVVPTTTSGIDSPTISQRRVGTTVAVSSDQTVALGGLIQDDTDQIRTGIPILSSLPFIGPLFGSTTDRTERTELLVLITPKVLPDSNAAVAATDELRRRLERVAPLESRIGRPFGGISDEPPAIDGTGLIDETRPAPVTSRRSDREFLVQLASLPSRADAAEAWEIYRNRFANLIGDLRHRIDPAVINGERGFRLQIGPLPDYDDADDLCRRLMAEGGDCLVVEARNQ